MTFSAYASYQESADMATLPGTDGLIAIDTQKGNASFENQERIDFLFASDVQALLGKPNVSFMGNAQFQHKMVRT